MFDIVKIENAELKAILEKQESYLLDFKSRDIAPAKLQTHFVAFANADGGDLYIGVDETPNGFSAAGFSSPEDANNIISHLLNETKPPVEGVVAAFLLTPYSGHILQVTVPKSDKVHHTATGECYVRMNASSQKIKGEESIRIAYSKGFYKFEEQPVKSAELTDITESKYFQDFMRRMSSTQEPARFLRRNKLLTELNGEAKPTVASVLLFDEEPQELLSSKCSVKIIRMRTTSEEYLRAQLHSSETIVGPIEFIAQEAERRIFDIMRESTSAVDGGPAAVSYPVETVHEILVNAILHRDYSIADDVHVTIFDNRIEIKSPGKLPGNVTVSNILQSHSNRNPNIVRIINKLPNPINHDLGEGLSTAFKAMTTAGLVRPEIIESENSVVVRILHKRLESYENQIMDYLGANSFITNKIARQLTGEGSENRIKKSLSRLKQAGRIELVDPNARPFDQKYRIAHQRTEETGEAAPPTDID